MRLLIQAPLAPLPKALTMLGVRIWRHGSAVWSPLCWLAAQSKYTAAFDVVPQAQLLVMVLARTTNETGQLCDILLGTGAYTVDPTNSHKMLEIQIMDHWRKTCQMKLRAVLETDDESKAASQPPLPKYMLLLQPAAAPKTRKEPKIDYEDEFVQFQRGDASETQRLIDALPIMMDFDQCVRGEMKGPLGRAMGVLPWLQYVTQESVPRTASTYFPWIAMWYLRWAGIKLVDFCKRPYLYPDVLSFVCGHHVWTYAYCADEYVSSDDPQKMSPCDTWATGRWIPSAVRATDCEDNAADIVATFRSLQSLSLDAIVFEPDAGANTETKRLFATRQQEHRSVAKALLQLANQYTALLADTTLWLDHDPPQQKQTQTGPQPQERKTDKRAVLHMYVKLVPTEQLHMLLEPDRRAVNKVNLPIMTLDSTRRCWTPARSISTEHNNTLKQLHMTLRQLVHAVCVCHVCRQGTAIHDNCQCLACDTIQSVGEYFSWGTPCDQWQAFTKGMDQQQGLYHTDLRYYDVANGRVYMPRLRAPNKLRRDTPKRDTIIFGVPALSLDGFLSLHGVMPQHLLHADAYQLPPADDADKTVSTDVELMDITDVYMQQGPFGQQRKSPVTTNASTTAVATANVAVAVPVPDDTKRPKASESGKIPLPPVPRIHFDFTQVHASMQYEFYKDKDRSVATIPVFIRPEDARECAALLDPQFRNATAVGDLRDMCDTAALLEAMSIVSYGSERHMQSLFVVRMERMYVQEPRQFVYVFYVTARTKARDSPFTDYLAKTKY